MYEDKVTYHFKRTTIGGLFRYIQLSAKMQAAVIFYERCESIEQCKSEESLQRKKRGEL